MTVLFSALSNHPPIQSRSFSDFLLWILGRRRLFRVVGHSMYPTLKEGDRVLVDFDAYKNQLPEVGELVLARDPLHRNLKTIKRVTAVVDNQKVYLKGDYSLESTDSRSFGTHLSLVYGRVSSLFL